MDDPAKDTRERLRREIEDTRLALHRLPDSLPDEAFSLPSGNPARRNSTLREYSL